MRIVCSFYRITAGRSTVLNRIMVSLRVLVVYLRTLREQKDTGIYLRNSTYTILYCTLWWLREDSIIKKKKIIKNRNNARNRWVCVYTAHSGNCLVFFFFFVNPRCVFVSYYIDNILIFGCYVFGGFLYYLHCCGL